MFYNIFIEMKNAIWLLLAGLLLTINTCDILVDHYEDKDVFTTYYMGDRCIIALGGTCIVKKTEYEYSKKTCDRTAFFIIYQEDILEDYIIKDTWGSERCLKFRVNKTNAKEGGGICCSGVCLDEKKEIGTTTILPDIKLQKVDSIIIEIFYEYY